MPEGYAEDRVASRAQNNTRRAAADPLQDAGLNAMRGAAAGSIIRLPPHRGPAEPERIIHRHACNSCRRPPSAPRLSACFLLNNPSIAALMTAVMSVEAIHVALGAGLAASRRLDGLCLSLFIPNNP
jgi:hypothetical protein